MCPTRIDGMKYLPQLIQWTKKTILWSVNILSCLQCRRNPMKASIEEEIELESLLFCYWWMRKGKNQPIFNYTCKIVAQWAELLIITPPLPSVNPLKIQAKNGRETNEKTGNVEGIMIMVVINVKQTWRINNKQKR